MSRDWVEWHRAYDDPASSLSQRLAEVSRMVRDALDAAAPGLIRVLSLCAGDARDIAFAVAGHPRADDVTGVAVELDPSLAAAARGNLASTGLSVVEGDAGLTATFADALPVDVLLLCGIFGNISLDDIRATVCAVPAMTRSGATVIWTRHRREPDATSLIRQWFDAAGCTSVEFVSPGAGSFAIGCERSPDSDSAAPLPARLFTFLDDAW